MTDELTEKLYGYKKNPIYIYAPRYIEESAGIRALHYLCHALNQTGNPAWLVVHGLEMGEVPTQNGQLNTPLLSEEIRDQHFGIGAVPIVIYPETIPGNPLKAQVIIRWLLNYPGVLGGPKEFDERDYLVAYSSKIAGEYGGEIPVLFLPALDLREIEETKHNFENQKRTDQILLYAGKYRQFVGKPLLPKWAPTEYTEIWREGPLKQERKEVLRLLATSSCLFIFENSTLINEAVLLGCPVILIKSTFFDSLIAEEELGNNGTAWSDAINPLEKALSELENVSREYIDSISHFFVNLELEVNNWTTKASNFDYIAPIQLPQSTFLISRHRISLAIQILKTQGFITLLRIIRSFFRRRLAYASRK
jgi:hypothetical protein